MSARRVEVSKKDTPRSLTGTDLKPRTTQLLDLLGDEGSESDA